jgi:putative protein-disulfide isomerase
MLYTLIYCYDAYCGWCYGFSPIMQQIAAEYSDQVFIEVLSGGMIITERPVPIRYAADFIKSAYPLVEARTGIRFGKDFLWHIFHPEQSDWLLQSEKPAIALCVFKEYEPALQLAFASDLQYALNAEGRDLCDDEAYRHLLHKYKLDETPFYQKLHDPVYKKKAREEFDGVKRLKVTGFPALLLQTKDKRFYQLTNGYTDYMTLRGRLETALAENASAG